MKPFNGFNRKEIHEESKNFHSEKIIKRLGCGCYTIIYRIGLKTGNLYNIHLYEKYKYYNLRKD